MLPIPNAGKDLEQEDTLLLFMGMQSGTATLEDSLAVSYKSKHTLTTQSSNDAPDIYPKKWKIYVHTKNLHMGVYSSFIHNCQNLEAAKMSFNRWIDKLWYIQAVEYYSVLKRNELSSHEKKLGNLKCILLTERDKPEKTTYCMIPTMWHSEKGEI